MPEPSVARGRIALFARVRPARKLIVLVAGTGVPGIDGQVAGGRGFTTVTLAATAEAVAGMTQLEEASERRRVLSALVSGVWPMRLSKTRQGLTV